MTESSKQPHNLEAEEGLIACCLSDGDDVINSCIEAKLKPEMFFKTSHQLIYQIILDLHGEGHPVDEIILLERMRLNGSEDQIGGISAIYRIQDRVETTSHARYFLTIVKENFALRQIIRTSRQAIEDACSQTSDSSSISVRLESAARDISDGTQGSSTIVKSDELVKSAVATLVDKMNNPDREEDVVSTHMSSLNSALPCGGFWAGDLVIIAARPSVGKTALAMNFAEHNSVVKGKNTLIFSFEMMPESLINRICASNAGISARSIQEATLNSNEQKLLHDAYKRVSDSNIFIDSDKTLDVYGIRSRALQLHNKLRHEGGVNLVVVDYLQLSQGSDRRMPREQQIAEMSRVLKILADELACPVIALSQLNRESEKNDRAPRMSDLRESGSIEQDASTIILLHRLPPEHGYPDSVYENVDLILAKVREGEVGTVQSTFMKICTKFQNRKAF